MLLMQLGIFECIGQICRRLDDVKEPSNGAKVGIFPIRSREKCKFLSFPLDFNKKGLVIRLDFVGFCLNKY